MAELKENGENPMNARINIKYLSKKPPKIKFSYPSKRTQSSGSMFSTICLAWFLIVVIGYYGSVIGVGFNQFESMYGKSHLQGYAECAAENQNQTLNNYTNVRMNLCDAEIEEDNILWWLAGFLSLFFIPPTIIYFSFRKQWNKLYPAWQSFTSRKKQRIFKIKDIQEKDGRIYCELPVFNNVVCDFKAKGDFSKYLEEIDIREYKFNYLTKKVIKIGKKKKKFKKVNEWIWYARWYFDKKPTSGYLEVIYK